MRRTAQTADKEGKDRLRTIIVTESAWLIWTLRCKWRIDSEGRTDEIPTTEEVRNRWQKRINIALTMDITASNEKRYKEKAIDPTLCESTWVKVVNNEVSFKNSLRHHRNDGVLVSIDDPG
jgi:hypothetical protein